MLDLSDEKKEIFKKTIEDEGLSAALGDFFLALFDMETPNPNGLTAVREFFVFGGHNVAKLEQDNRELKSIIEDLKEERTRLRIRLGLAPEPAEEASAAPASPEGEKAPEPAPS